MDVVYDVADKEDIQELVRLRIAYTREDLGSLSEDDERMMKNFLPDFFERNLNQNTFSFVARADGHVGDVLSVYTEPEYRGSGICTKLMEKMIDAAKQLGICRLTLSATDDGYPVYKKVGFEDKVTKYKDMIMHI